MAGHSKWANIKHRKAAQDAKRGKIFTKIIRELTVAARLGGPNPEDNPRLRAVVDKALTANMKKDTIERAIERGAGGGDDGNYEELTYEGYGPGGVAIYVEAMTDNRNRTVAEVRHAFSKHGGNLGTDGSVAYLFTKQGVISYGPGVDEDKLMEAALEAGAEDLAAQDDGSFEIVTAPEQFLDVKEALVNAGLTPDNAEVTMVPSTRVELDRDGAETILKLIDMLEDLDDVQNVYHNAEISAEIMDSL
ncbi:YebC/PmpR family DNA-binding transcriptional regulator [Marinobacter lutaoensis]|jgi:YebC/PmpR family DNA-binding regulatory protein|uniref:YebC/PmpR family DNA-binding transcriptional regulator n=1 Tax=Marinobacter lutaoensis TaxID=135739 RepID=UPI000C09D104|nr:YebC/PmpR family DNA-binding transcriptional regulator [Marinobacter lutaoensis]MBE02775.1 YebC/PmpR family DNA-binding transcriptional regulator [Marinobacter sp.]MBI42507.1 YebC/PmpR family DNA-binding transcriptional regulator [Oceanospirillales bacterium]NVD35431.1 YebC/PmpR family DNA-binding transcriptional regulator [Marinobacter lutaoensis]|tara:strand:- start:1974 stop:2717 length:744 start_codon:yes stop_codon:yes gene_type:complete